MNKFTLTANLIQALQNYLGSRPFNEVANLMLALQQQISTQLPPETANTDSVKQSESVENT